MDTERVTPETLEALRVALAVDDGGASALGWAAVHAFEREHGIVLPEPYRSFVAEISDGSHAGPPDFGLVGLAEMPDDWESDGDDRNLAAPFPLTEAWLWEDDPDAEDDEVDRVLSDGSIVLGTDGCASYWHLVVSGPQRGHIWNVTDVGATPYTGAEPGFLGWVRQWAAGTSV